MPLTKIPCPTCETLTEYRLDNPYRPFCCERCKLIDLGEWANDGYKIAGSEMAVDDSDSE